jgi:hypothetical protein
MRLRAEAARVDEYRCVEPCPVAAVVRAAIDAYFDRPVGARDVYLMPHDRGE